MYNSHRPLRELYFRAPKKLRPVVFLYFYPACLRHYLLQIPGTWYCICGPAIQLPVGSTSQEKLRFVAFALCMFGIVLPRCCNPLPLVLPGSAVCTSWWIPRPSCGGFDPAAFRYCAFNTNASFLSTLSYAYLYNYCTLQIDQISFWGIQLFLDRQILDLDYVRDLDHVLRLESGRSSSYAHVCLGGICMIQIFRTCLPGWDVYDLHDLRDVCGV